MELILTMEDLLFAKSAIDARENHNTTQNISNGYDNLDKPMFTKEDIFLVKRATDCDIVSNLEGC